MTILVFSFLLLLASFTAGLVGSLTGLGGGIVLIPVLVLLFHIDIHYAMGASLISVIATSSGAAAAYLKEGFTNIRIGMFLEVGAVIGALIGALLVAFVSPKLIAVLFALFLFASAYFSLRRNEKIDVNQPSHLWADRLRLAGSYKTADGVQDYSVHGVPEALGIMTIAGALAGLLGIGAGALKVLAMDQMMRLPYKVSTSTSNFIIGITAAVSMGVYFKDGYIVPGIIFPVLIGVAIGALFGAKILVRAKSRGLRLFFSIIILLLGVEMLYKALTGGI